MGKKTIRKEQLSQIDKEHGFRPGTYSAKTGEILNEVWKWHAVKARAEGKQVKRPKASPGSTVEKQRHHAQHTAACVKEWCTHKLNEAKKAMTQVRHLHDDAGPRP